AQRARLPQVHSGRWQGGGEQVGAVDPGHAFGVPCADAEGGPGGGPAGGADERGHRYSFRVWWQVCVSWTAWSVACSHAARWRRRSISAPTNMPAGATISRVMTVATVSMVCSSVVGWD